MVRSCNPEDFRKKRVGLLVSCWASEGGVIRVAAELSNRMAEDHLVHLIELHGDGDLCAYPLDKRVRTKSLLRGDGYRLSDYLFRARKPLIRYLKDEEIDVLLLLGTYPGVLGIVPWIGLKTKVVFCDHGAIVNQLHDKQITLIRFLASKFCACTVSLTERNKKDYALLYTQARKVRVIPNWIPNRLWARLPSYDAGSRSAIWVGRLDAEKGVDQLLKIVELAKGEMRELGWKIDVFGSSVLDGSMDIASELLSRSLDDLVVLRGSVDDIYDRYSSYGLYLLTSYREGLPLALLESQACGLPCVAFDVATGPSDIVENGINGVLVEPTNCELFAREMLKMMKSDKVRRSMSSCSRSKIMHFQEDEVYSQWSFLIADLVGEN